MTSSLSPPDFLDRAGAPRLAYRFRDGAGPVMVFLPGYMSDMLGGKAAALDNWAAGSGRAMLRLDYAGNGESGGDLDPSRQGGTSFALGCKRPSFRCVPSCADDPIVCRMLFLASPIML